MQEIEDVTGWVGADAVDQDDEKLGKVEEIFLDRRSGEGTFASLKSGLLKATHHAVPLDGATFARGYVRFPYPKDQVTSGPEVSSNGVTRRDAIALHRHYGLAGDLGQGDDDDLCYETSASAAERKAKVEADLARAEALEREARARDTEVGSATTEAAQRQEAAERAAAERDRLLREAAEAREAAERDGR